jgi:outer membrane protein assembly factor BamB
MIDLMTAIFTSAVVSSDNKFLYLNSAAWKFYCLDAKTGDRIWIDEDSDSSYMVQPKLVEIPGEVPVVYTIEVCNAI